jgi:hypothetical protein
MDGISGFKIYNKIKLNLKFLSKDYRNFLNFIITEINHKLSDQDWETELSAILHPETEIISPAIKRAKQIVNIARTPPTPVGIPGGGLLANADVTDTAFWVYIAWQQGSFGAQVHYEIIKGRRDKYPGNGRNTGVPPQFLSDNWPSAYIASNGVGKKDVRSLWNVSPDANRKLSSAFIEMQQHYYNIKSKNAPTQLNKPGVNDAGLAYSVIRDVFVRVANEEKHPFITANVLATFAQVENSLQNDTANSSTYQTMFQMNKTFTTNTGTYNGKPFLSYRQIIDKYNDGPNPKKPGFINYGVSNFYGFVKDVFPQIANGFNIFVKSSGYPN